MPAAGRKTLFLIRLAEMLETTFGCALMVLSRSISSCCLREVKYRPDSFGRVPAFFSLSFLYRYLRFPSVQLQLPSGILPSATVASSREIFAPESHPCIF